MTKMRNSQLLQLMQHIIGWQLDPTKHPLTCGNSSDHPPLYPLIVERRVTLACAHCDYRQELPEWIGEMVR